MKADIQALIESAKRHREADDYIRGSFGEIVDGQFKGCSVGCTIHDIDPEAHVSDHEFLADQLSVPVELIYFQDLFFENLEDNRDWTVDFLSAIPTTPSNVIPRFLLEIVPVVDDDYYRLTKKFLENWRDNGGKDEALRKAARSAAESAARLAKIKDMSETLLNIMRGEA